MNFDVAPMRAHDRQDDVLVFGDKRDEVSGR